MAKYDLGILKAQGFIRNSSNLNRDRITKSFEKHPVFFFLMTLYFIRQTEFERGKSAERIRATCGRRGLIWSTNYPVPDSRQQRSTPNHGDN